MIKTMSITTFGHLSATPTELHPLNPRCRNLSLDLVLVSETAEILDQSQSLTLRNAVNICAPEQNDVSDVDDLHRRENRCFEMFYFSASDLHQVTGSDLNTMSFT